MPCKFPFALFILAEDMAMTFSRFPANPEALFSAAHDAYANIKIHEDKRMEIADEIIMLSQVDPSPIDRLTDLMKRMHELNDKIRQLSRDAESLNNSAVLGLISSSDVVNAKKALECANGKATLALNKLAQFSNFLAISTAYVDFLAAVAKAAATAPAGLLAIAEIIDKFQKLVSIKLQETLTEEQYEQIKKELTVNCVESI